MLTTDEVATRTAVATLAHITSVTLLSFQSLHQCPKPTLDILAHKAQLSKHLIATNICNDRGRLGCRAHTAGNKRVRIAEDVVLQGAERSAAGGDELYVGATSTIADIKAVACDLRLEGEATTGLILIGLLLTLA